MSSLVVIFQIIKNSRKLLKIIFLTHKIFLYFKAKVNIKDNYDVFFSQRAHKILIS